MSRVFLFITVLAMGLATPYLSYGDGECLVLSFASDGSTGLPRGWKPLLFPKISRHTSYKVESDDGKFWIRAESRASASALVRELQLDPKVYPILRWRWKVENIIQSGNEQTKAGDDHAARIYVNFRYDPENGSLWEKAQYGLAYRIYGNYPPKGAINYIWANKLPLGRSIDNAYTSKSKMVAVESGTERIGEWINEERNIYQDYISLFAEEPPPVVSIAIMTDTDNTHDEAVAYYGEISLCKG